MHSAIDPRLEKLERQKRELLAAVAGLSETRLRFRPAPNAWCILEVLDHLVKVEQSWVRGVRKNLPSSTPLTIRDRLGVLLVNSVMRSPLRVRVPEGAPMVLPHSITDLAEITHQWVEVRKDVADLLASLPPEQLRRGLFRHPVAGWMNAAGSLAFCSAHLQHHCYQIDRLKVASRTATLT